MRQLGSLELEITDWRVRLSEWPRIVKEVNAGSFGPFSLIEQVVEVSPGCVEIWRLVSRAGTIRIVIRDEHERFVLVQIAGKDGGWQLLDFDGMPSDVDPCEFTERSLGQLGMSVTECLVLGSSSNAATIRHPVTFIDARVRDLARVPPGAAVFSSSEIFRLLRGGDIHGDRSVRYLYDLLPLVLTRNSWKISETGRAKGDTGQSRETDLREGQFGIFSLIRVNGDFWVRRPDGVRIAAFDDADRLLLTHEKRSELNGWDWRLPGGKVKNGDMYEAARKELADETGFAAEDWSHIYESLDEKGIQYKLQYFSARKLTPGRQALHGAEQIVTSWHSAEDVFALLRSRAISEDRTGRVLYQMLQVIIDGNVDRF